MNNNSIKGILEAIHHLTTTLVYDESANSFGLTKDEYHNWTTHLAEAHISVGEMLNILEKTTKRTEVQN